MPATSAQRKNRKDDEFKWRATTWRRRRQWRRWENVGLKPHMGLDDLDLKWTDPRIRGMDILGATSEITLERTIEGASTLTIQVKDPFQNIFSSARRRTGRTSSSRLTPAQRRAQKKKRQQPIDVDEGWNPINPPYLRGRACEVKLNGAGFRLVKVAYSHADKTATLTFEDEIVYLLKRKFGERRAKRTKVTRAQFILSQLRELKSIKPPFICPELTVKQPLDRPNVNRRTTTRSSTGGSGGDAGFSPNADLRGADHTGATYPITGDKRRNAAKVLNKADEITGDHKPRLALIEACNIESKFTNSAAMTDHDSQGILQARRSLHGAKALDIEWCVERFLSGPSWTGAYGGAGAVKLAKQHPDWSAGKIAQTIQGSAFGSRYDAAKEASEKLLRQWGGAGGSDEGTSTTRTHTYSKTYQYQRKRGESAYNSINRLAEEVGWRFFPVGEAVYYMSEEQLYNRRIRYTFKPGDNTILDLNYDIDWGKPVSECTLTVTLDRWGAPPGSVVELDGWEVPDGRWLVKSVRRDWFSPIAEVTLKQPGRAKMEPASERVTRSNTTTTGGTDGSATDPDAGSKVETLIANCKRFTGSYGWGGGHVSNMNSLSFGTNMDCSGSTSFALFKSGMYDGRAARVASDFSNWGSRGTGDEATVWYNGGHVFIQGQGWRFDTGGPGGGSGPRFRRQERSTSGFSPRHWPGT